MAKRFFDIFFSFWMLVFALGIIFLAWIIVCIDTKSNGFFLQKRVGQNGKLFTIYKLKTIHPISGKSSNLGNFLRKSKLDELPQLLNVFFGEMSFVGPRPDIPGYYDLLEGENRKILELKPGITSMASIKYREEDTLLSQQKEPLRYNDTILFPDKVKLNLEYYYTNSILGDIKILWKTIFTD